MWIKLLLKSLIFFVFFNAYNADDKTSCIEVKPAENFDAKNYSGDWFVYAMQFEKLSNSNCVRYVIYSREDDDTLPTICLYKEKGDNSTHMLMKNAKINETGQGETFDGYKNTVVALKYEHWAVLIACDEKANKRVVWILTSTPKPKPTSILSVDDVLKKYGLKMADLQSVSQENCPTDWSDAAKDEVDFKYDDVKDDLIMRGIVKE